VNKKSLPPAFSTVFVPVT